MFESLGPNFFFQISKEEEGGSSSEAPDAALYEKYHVELSATGIALVDVDNFEEDRPTKVGSATLFMTGTRVQGSENLYRSCKIEQLDVEIGDILAKVEAFTAILRRIQSFCVEHHAEHLAMAPIQDSSWFSGLLRSVGFNLCGCERPGKHFGAGVQLCMELPTPPIELPASIVENSSVDDSATGESNEIAATATSKFATEMSNIVDQYNRLMHKMQKEVKALERQRVPTRRRDSSSTGSSTGSINETRSPYHWGGKGFLAPTSIGQPRASPSTGIAPTPPSRQDMINETGFTVLDKNDANAAAVDEKEEKLQLTTALRSNVVRQGKKLELACSSSDLADKPAEEPAEEQANRAGRRFKQEAGVAVEGSALGKLSLPQSLVNGKCPAAAEEATILKGSKVISPRPRVKEHYRRSLSREQDLTHSTTNKATGSSNTSKNARHADKIAELVGSLPKKVYCTYWIWNGQCHYMPNCQFKHEMPVDEETRQSMGLREIPLWYKESPEYAQFLQQAERSAASKSTVVASGDKDTFLAQLSKHGLGRSNSDIGSHEGGLITATSHNQVKIELRGGQSLYETQDPRTLAWGPKVKTVRAGLPSATKIDRFKTAEVPAGRRRDKGIYKPPGAVIFSGGSDIRAATEGVKVKDSKIEEPPKGHAESHGGFRILGISARSDQSKEQFSPSSSAVGSAPSMLPGRMSTRPYSPGSDADDQKTGRGLKRARTGR